MLMQEGLHRGQVGLLAEQPLLLLSELCRISEGLYLVEQMVGSGEARLYKDIAFPQ